MDYINILKTQNIHFNFIKEIKAEEILSNECSLYRLTKLSTIFEKYRATIKKGQFVNLDFSQLYYISIIDEEFSHIIMQICLEIEFTLKTILINDAHKLNVEREFLTEYIKRDYDYLHNRYLTDIDSLLANTDDTYLLEEFLDTILFGTFVKFVYSFYKKYAPILYGKKSAPFEKYLNSVHFIRNKVAHNVPLLSELTTKTNITNPKLYEYLKSKGIKSKTLYTNLTKTLVCDICNILHLYCAIQSDVKIRKNFKTLQQFKSHCCKKYVKYFKGNDILKSSYNFYKKIIIIYSKKTEF